MTWTTRRSSTATVLVMAWAAAAYYVGVQVGMALRFPPATTSVLWPPNATLTAALLLVPFRRWWWCCLAVLPVHLVTEIGAGLPPLLVAAFFVTNCSEALLAAAGLRWLSDAPTRLDTFPRVLAFLVAVGVAAPMLSSFADAGAVSWLRAEAYWTVWQTRTFANVLTELSIVPLALLIASRIEWAVWPRPARMVEAAVLAVTVTMAAQWMLAGRTAEALDALRSPAVLLPFFFWAAVRFGVGGVSAMLLLAAALASAEAKMGHRPFEGLPPAQSLMAAQMYLAVIGCPLMCVAGLLEERRDTAKALAQQLRFEALLSAMSGAFIHVRHADMSAAFDENLQRVGEFLRVDYVSLLQVCSAEGELEVVHRWTTDRAAALRTVHCTQAFPWTFQRALAGDLLVCESDEGLPGHATIDRASMRAAGIRAAVVQPLMIGGRIRGTLTVATLGPRAWSREDVTHVCLMAEVIANACALRQAELEIEQTRRELAHAARLSSMGELTASLAHQLNQPLAGILNNAEAAAMLIDGGRASPAELREVVAEIMDDDRRAGEVIRRMREMLTRADRPPVRLDVNAVVRDAASLIASDTIIRNVSIAFECDAGPLPIVGSKIDLQEALLNVLMNAMDALNGRVVPDRQIVVRTSRDEDRIRIAVRDRGAGLVAGTEQRIFEPFFSTKESGMGMGLAVARSLLGHHHGTIAAANHPDGGAVVTIDLPAAAEV
jgi:C4-dicarboxylate-specific signal transduction histidine kinase